MNTCQLCKQNETADYLCPGCATLTERRLNRMPQLYTALAAFLAPAARPQRHGGSRQGGPAPLPASERVLDLRGPGGMVGVLERWRSAMQQDRQWGEPVLAGDIERRVHKAARALLLNLEWITASWPEAGRFAGEIRDLERDVASVVVPAELGIRLGQCPSQVSQEQVCGAVLRYRPGDTAVTCRWCGTVYRPPEWQNLRAWIDLDESNRREQQAC